MASIFHDIYIVKQGGAIAIFVFFFLKKKRRSSFPLKFKKKILYFSRLCILKINLYLKYRYHLFKKSINKLIS